MPTCCAPRIASAGNDHRLGANEAPPAIISIFLGDMLTDILAQVEQGLPKRTLQGGTLDLGARTLPQLPRHSGDRNRTVPFAFTGNKFEFRAVGSSASIAWPNTVLNTIVAESLDYIATELEKAAGANPSPAKLQDAVLERAQEGSSRSTSGSSSTATTTRRTGTRKRNARPAASARLGGGVPGAQGARRPSTCSRSTACSTRPRWTRGIHIAVEKYVKQLGIEADTAVNIARTMVLPAALQHQELLAGALNGLESAGVKSPEQKKALEDFAGLVSTLRRATAKLEKARRVPQRRPVQARTADQGRREAGDGRPARDRGFPGDVGVVGAVAAPDLPGHAVPGIGREDVD